jgi:hypothetical protein
MAGWNIYQSETTGQSIEIPARAPGSPANLWIHFAFNATNWSGAPTDPQSSDWRRQQLVAILNLEPGDIPIAGLGCVGVAGIQRDTQGLFNTDDWGVAFDTFAPAAPGSVEFVGDMAVLGKCWPFGIWLAVDLLVLRPSLIPPVPIPYGTYPTRKIRWDWPVQTYIGLVSNIAHLTGDQRKELRRMNRELEELLAADEPSLVEPDKPVVKRAKLSLQMIPTGNLARWTAPAIGIPSSATASEPKAAEKKKPATPARKPRPRRS